MKTLHSLPCHKLMFLLTSLRTGNIVPGQKEIDICQCWFCDLLSIQIFYMIVDRNGGGCYGMLACNVFLLVVTYVMLFTVEQQNRMSVGYRENCNIDKKHPGDIQKGKAQCVSARHLWCVVVTLCVQNINVVFLIILGGLVKNV